MFVIGDLIFMPFFGAGCIVNIEDRKIHGEISRYYIINFVLNKISMMIPVFSEEAQKIRRTITIDECEELINILYNSYKILPSKWNERLRCYNDAIKSGDIFFLGRLLKNCSDMSKTKKMSKSETKIYKEVLGLVASEISIVLNRDYNLVKIELIELLDDNK
jgi:CarD family transcriptional regulator